MIVGVTGQISLDQVFHKLAPSWFDTRWFRDSGSTYHLVAARGRSGFICWKVNYRKHNYYLCRNRLFSSYVTIPKFHEYNNPYYPYYSNILIIHLHTHQIRLKSNVQLIVYKNKMMKNKIVI